MQLHSLSLSLNSFSSSVSSTNPHSSSSSPPTFTPSRFIKFRTSHRENLRYLKTLGIVTADDKPKNLPLPDDVERILAAVDFLKSKGFSNADFPRLAFLSPNLFSPGFDPAGIAPVFDFLASDVAALPEESCRLILRCPALLFSNVEYCLRPTLDYLRKLGLERLNSPTTLNAHLLNTRVEKLQKKMKFLRSIGLSYDESARICARIPAIFGYSVEDNLRPKYEYLVWEMERSLDELKRFPQYFAFSLKKRIVPRHSSTKS